MSVFICPHCGGIFPQRNVLESCLSLPLVLLILDVFYLRKQLQNQSIEVLRLSIVGS